MNNIIKDIYDHICRAKTEAIKRNIEANQIIIDKGLAITNHIYFTNVDGSMCDCEPMMLGLAIVYQENLAKDGYNFIMNFNPRLDEKPKTLADYTTRELLEELQRRNEEDD